MGGQAGYSGNIPKPFQSGGIEQPQVGPPGLGGGLPQPQNPYGTGPNQGTGSLQPILPIGGIYPYGSQPPSNYQYPVPSQPSQGQLGLQQPQQPLTGISQDFGVGEWLAGGSIGPRPGPVDPYAGIRPQPIGGIQPPPNQLPYTPDVPPLSYQYPVQGQLRTPGGNIPQGRQLGRTGQAPGQVKQQGFPTTIGTDKLLNALRALLS